MAAAWETPATPPPIMSTAAGATRYVAGNEFFNYMLFGGLRTGGSVSLWMKAYVGYAVAAFFSGYVYAVVNYLLLRLSDRTLRLEDSRALRGVLTLQWSVVLFVGVLSDCVPMHLPRRRPFMIVAWSLGSLLWLALFVVCQASHTSLVPKEVTTTLVSVAFLCLLVATNALDIRIIELSQQEHLRERGRLLGVYQMTRIMGQVVAHSFITAIVKTQRNSMDLELPFNVDWVFLHLAFICVLVVVMLVQFAQEKPVHKSWRPHETASTAPASHAQPDLLSTAGGDHHLALSITTHATRASVSRGNAVTRTVTIASKNDSVETSQSLSGSGYLLSTLRVFWRCAQQKVMWQLMVFNCIFFCFGLVEIGEVRRAVQIWARDTAVTRNVRGLLGDIGFVAVIALWRQHGVNVCWRGMTAGTILFSAACSLLFSSLIIFDVTRSPWLNTTSYIVRAPIRMLALLLPFVPTIEVAHLGSEGTTYALIATFDGIVRVLGSELARVLVNAWPELGLPPRAIRRNQSKTQWTAFYGVLIMAGCAIVPLVCLRLLPRQKLDAQQLRVYGGYSKLPVVLLSIGYLVGFPYVLYLQVSRVGQ
ncbi:hypothetical protein PINS_up000770 [Pythium insidiosum]|nr:hypothetical protein PINS_up000770 [Pythium insidiosum]